jgi:hypothetical protein
MARELKQMADTWNLENEGHKVTVHVEKDGETRDFVFDSTKNVKDALHEIGGIMHLSQVNVFNDSEEEIGPNEAHKALGDVGDLTVYPKAGGA